MIEFERLAETGGRLVEQLREGGLERLDETLTASRTTAGTYRYTYDRYLQYFREKRGQPLTEQDLYIGFAFAYSWMASIKQLDPALATVKAATAALNELHAMQPASLDMDSEAAADISDEQVENLAAATEPLRYFLGSVIGTSKLLHFVNPEVFPIWDAIIHRYSRLPKTSAADSLRLYAQYTCMVHRLTHHADFETRIYEPLLRAMEAAHRQVGKRYRAPEPMGKVRATEFIMFFGGKAEHAPA
ncbi:MAG: hypothetical protein H0V62_11705 [Gammaproteobacteria bacterium]|nr:hypothetical protein [Gammaproteobacteria bacterium]